MRLSISILISAFLLQACIANHAATNSSSFSPIADKEQENISGDVDIYFEGAKLSKNVEHIAMIEAEGLRYSSYSEVLNHLKQEAHLLGADAVINVRRNYRDEKTGDLFDVKRRDKYSPTLVFWGMAVKVSDQKKSM